MKEKKLCSATANGKKLQYVSNENNYKKTSGVKNGVHTLHFISYFWFVLPCSHGFSSQITPICSPMCFNPFELLEIKNTTTRSKNTRRLYGLIYT